VVWCVAACSSGVQSCSIYGMRFQQIVHASCVAVCCSVLQCVAACCGALRRVVARCTVLQCVAVCCSVLQCVAVCFSVLQCVVLFCKGVKSHSINA